MHVSQISAPAKGIDDSSDRGRVARPASNGEGFQSVYSGGTSAEEAEPHGSGAGDPEYALVAGRAGKAQGRGTEASLDREPGVTHPASKAGARELESGPRGEEPRKGATDPESPSETEIADGWALPGFAPAPLVPSAANSQRLQGFSQAQQPPVTSAATTANAVAQALVARGAVAGSDNAATPTGVLEVPASGGEQPLVSTPPNLSMAAGSSARDGVLPAGMVGQAGVALEALPDMAGEAGSEASGNRPGELSSVAAASRTDGGAATAASDDQSSEGMQMPFRARELPNGAHETRAEARSLVEETISASPNGAKGEMSLAASAASGSLSSRADAETGALALSGARGLSGENDGLFSVDESLVDPLLSDTRTTARTPTAGTLPVLQSADTPRQVALQIAEVIRASGERAVELKLQPEELGRVHLTMSQDATGTLTVSLNVERAETLDLLRRNIDLLGADLQELGYENINFSFQGDGTGAEQDARPGRSDGAVAFEAETGTPHDNPPQTGTRGAQASGDGMDIRI